MMEIENHSYKNSDKTISIKIESKDKEQYKSISNLFWENIPPLAILTGPNGSGKTQLLELLSYHISGIYPYNKPFPMVVKIIGQSFGKTEFAYIPSTGDFSGGQPISISSMTHSRRQLLQNIYNQGAQQINFTKRLKDAKILEKLNGRHYTQISDEEIEEIFSDDFEFMLEDIDVTSGLSYVFLAYRLKAAANLEKKEAGRLQDMKHLGPAPWDVVNESLKVAGFPYTVIPPTEYEFLQNYELKLRDANSKNTIRAIDLSSGEKVILQLILWIFSSSKEGRFPKLLIMDEPDAHLHPSMTTQFLDVVLEVLVKQHGIRVIITTHSPSTVSLAPDDSVFKMERGKNTIEKVTSKADIISTLTAGLVTVSRSTKFCFVEDEADVNFYKAIFEILTDISPNRDEMGLQPTPNIVFLPVSIGRNAEKIAGGCNVVRQWIEKLKTEPLNTFFIGIIDNDNKNTDEDRIFTIGRYSFENYLLDPINLFCILLEDLETIKINGYTINIGDEYNLKREENDKLQAICDKITNEMEKNNNNLSSSEKKEIQYTCGKKISAPAWVIEYRGHDLLKYAQTTFGGAKKITPQKLIKALKRNRFIPTELAKMFHRIQDMPK